MRLAGVAARRHGITDAVRPLRSGANHVFCAGDVVVRVAPPSADTSGQMALAKWLLAVGLPAAAPLGDAETVDGATVSLWEFIAPEGDGAIDYQQLGEVVGRLHRVPLESLRGVVALPF